MAAVSAYLSLFGIMLVVANALAAETETCGDGQLIFELPGRVEAASKASMEGWDSGVTAEMVQATSKYNDALEAMILDLNRTYYAEPAGQESIDEYVAALARVGQFERAAANPRNEAQGTIVSVDAGMALSEALEKTIEKMVEALIGEDTQYSLADWQKQWKAALGKTGEAESAESP